MVCASEGTTKLNNLPPRERKHRLPRETYIGRRSISFTACVEGRKKIFNEEDLMAAFVPLLGKSASLFACAVPIHTFMPDRMHVLMIGEKADSDMKAAMDKFKFATE